MKSVTGNKWVDGFDKNFCSGLVRPTWLIRIMSPGTTLCDYKVNGVE